MTMLLAHAGGPVLTPIEVVPALLLAGAYARRVRTLARTPRAVPGWRQVCLYGGVALLIVTLTSPISHLAEELFWVHMAEHLLIADLAALLLVLGMTGPVLAPVLRARALGWLRVLAHPLVALTLWVANLYVWHLPFLYEGALGREWVHALEHATFVGFGAAVWMALLGPLPKPLWFGNVARLLYVLAVRLLGAALANVILWHERPLYPDYRDGERYWGITPQSDQVLAGAVMMVEGSLITLGLFAWLFMRAAREGEERQQLLDLARARGVELDERRAARAVAAGRAAELRARLETGRAP